MRQSLREKYKKEFEALFALAERNGISAAEMEALKATKAGRFTLGILIVTLHTATDLRRALAQLAETAEKDEADPTL